MTITAHLRRSQTELAYCRAVCRLKQRSVRVHLGLVVYWRQLYDGSCTVRTMFIVNPWAIGRLGLGQALSCVLIVVVAVAPGRRIWIGNSGSKPVHATVRGRLLDGSLRSNGGGPLAAEHVPLTFIGVALTQNYGTKNVQE